MKLSIKSWLNRLPTFPIHVSRSAKVRSSSPPDGTGTTTTTMPTKRTRDAKTNHTLDTPEKRKWLLVFVLIVSFLVVNGRLLSLASTAIVTPYDPLQSYLPHWIISRQTTTTPSNLSSQTQTSNHFKIIILSMDRFESLNRLIRSLQNSHYDNDAVDLVVRFDLPKNPTDAWRSRVENLRSNVTWNHGLVDISVASENMGLRQAWLTAWRPTSDKDQAIIFEDDIEVSPLWYRWLQGAVGAYHNRTDVAGMSLQRQTLVPHKAHRNNLIPDNGGEPFLYKLVGSIGYAPVASKWRDFLDFAECALATNQAVDTPNLVTSDWYKNLDQRGMWTQLFIYFCDYMNLYTLYAFPPGKRALAAHWREKGEHYGKSEGPDFALISSESTGWNMEYPDNLPKLDWNARPSQQPPLRSVVLSAAVGYNVPDFYRFAQNIRAHYQGEVVLLVRHNSPPSLLDMLDKHDIKVVKTEETGGKRMTPAWYRVNTARWQFYQDQCQQGTHDFCMAVDFRDSLFQDDPFRGMVPGESTVMHVYEHNIPMNQWHLDIAYGCLGYNNVLKGKTIINAGGFIASPLAMPIVAQWVGVDAQKCDDQVALNLGIHGKNLSATVITHRQGEGSINNVAWGGAFRRDSQQRFLNHNCFPSPVVHQFDLIK